MKSRFAMLFAAAGLCLTLSGGILDSVSVNGNVVAWLGEERYSGKARRIVMPAGDSSAGTVKIEKTKTPGKMHVRVTVTPSPVNRLFYCGERLEFCCGWSGTGGLLDGFTLDTVDAKGVKRMNKLRLMDSKEVRIWGLNRRDYKTLVFAGEKGILRVTAGDNCMLGVSHYGKGYSFDAWYIVPDHRAKPAFDRPVSYSFTFEEHSDVSQ